MIANVRAQTEKQCLMRGGLDAVAMEDRGRGTVLDSVCFFMATSRDRERHRSDTFLQGTRATEFGLGNLCHGRRFAAKQI